MNERQQKARSELIKALNCLYIAVDETVARDVAERFYAYEAALSPAGTGQPDGAPEELAREIDHKVIQFIENPENGHKPFKQYCEDRIAMIASLLRSRMERAERPTELLNELVEARLAWHSSFGVPISAEYARFLDAIGKLQNWAAALPSAPDTERL